MLNTSGLLYLSARIISAAGNLLAVAVFSRLAGPAEYGHYVFIFAWSLIVYGFGAQWMRFAYFGVYHLERFGEYIASLARLLAAGLVLVALVLAGIGLFGLFTPGFLAAVFALVCGIAVYEAAFEVARTDFSSAAPYPSAVRHARSTSYRLQGSARREQFFDLIVRVPELGENISCVLAGVRRVTPRLSRGAAQMNRVVDRHDLAVTGMMEDQCHPVVDDLHVLKHIYESVYRTTRHIGPLQDGHPMGGRLAGERLCEVGNELVSVCDT